MTVKQQLINHIESLQEQADRMTGLELYQEYECLLPNDAIYPLRYYQLNELCDLIQQCCDQGYNLKTVINKSIKPNRDVIVSNFNHISQVIDVIIKDFS